MVKANQSTKKPLNYPKETKGSKWAAENRKRASALSDAERAALFKSGILRLYGGIARQTVRAGR
ncbi:MAG: hypothetical protein QOJ40_2117 [Verrucomicrobiota bacterium]|jgi:hypothetical protein